MGRLRFGSFMLLGMGLFCPACGPSPSKSEAEPVGHSHHSPHGGTVVELGKEEFHLELVHDSGSSEMTAYVLDGEMEKFVRLPQEEFFVRVGGQNGEKLRFRAFANPATGEKAGDTSEFHASSSLLTNNTPFDGVVVEIKIGSKIFQDVTFTYPKGHE